LRDGCVVYGEEKFKKGGNEGGLLIRWRTRSYMQDIFAYGGCIKRKEVRLQCEHNGELYQAFLMQTWIS